MARGKRTTPKHIKPPGMRHKRGTMPHGGLVRYVADVDVAPGIVDVIDARLDVPNVAMVATFKPSADSDRGLTADRLNAGTLVYLVKRSGESFAQYVRRASRTACHVKGIDRKALQAERIVLDDNGRTGSGASRYVGLLSDDCGSFVMESKCIGFATTADRAVDWIRDSPTVDGFTVCQRRNPDSTAGSGATSHMGRLVTPFADIRAGEHVKPLATD